MSRQIMLAGAPSNTRTGNKQVFQRTQHDHSAMGTTMLALEVSETKTQTQKTKTDDDKKKTKEKQNKAGGDRQRLEDASCCLLAEARKLRWHGPLLEEGTLREDHVSALEESWFSIR